MSQKTKIETLDRISTAECADQLNVAMSTVDNWMMQGVLCRSTGSRVKLAYRKIGGRRFVTQADIDAFIRTLNADQPQPTTNKRKRDADADAALTRLGINPRKKVA